MYENEWWRYVGMGRPKVPPDSFSEMEFLTFSDFRLAVGYTVLYHFILSKILNVLFENDLIGSYYFCRLVSFILILASFLLCYSVFRKLFNVEELDSNYLFWGAFFILFISQFLILSISVNSDAFSIFMSTVFFYASFCLIMGKFKVSYLILCIFSSVVGLFIDKSGFLAFFYCRKKKDDLFIPYHLLPFNFPHFHSFFVNTIFPFSDIQCSKKHESLVFRKYQYDSSAFLF